MKPLHLVPIALLMSLTVVLAQPAQRSAEIRRPSARDILTGPTVLELKMQATGGPVRDVVFQIDGREVCRITERPYRCDWSAGDQVAPRIVRAVITWVDGERLVRTVRTAGVAVQESATVESVIVSAHITDNRGRFVPGLTAANLIVKEDGVSQDLTFVGAEQVPSQVLLALDVSASMRESMATLREAARGFIAALRPSDSVSLTVFNTALFVVTPWGASAGTREAALDELLPWGGTAIYDSIVREPTC